MNNDITEEFSDLPPVEGWKPPTPVMTVVTVVLVIACIVGAVVLMAAISLI